MKRRAARRPSARELLSRMKGREEKAARQAACDLAHNGYDLKPLLPELCTLVRKGERESQRYDAAYILGQADKSQRVAHCLLTVLRDTAEAPGVRACAAEQLAFQGIGFLKPATLQRHVSAYIDGLRDPSPAVRFWCCYGLAIRRAALARPQLQRLAATDDEVCPGWGKVSAEAKYALARIDEFVDDAERLVGGYIPKIAQPQEPGESAFLRRALDLATENVRLNRGGPFGAVIVRDGQIIAQRSNLVTLLNDPTAHAEIGAIREACRILQTYDLSGCEIYSSCEPCPMCLGAIHWARLDRLVFAASRDDASRAGFDDSVLYDQLSMPIHRRSLLTRQMLRREGAAPFAAWKKSADKIPY